MFGANFFMTDIEIQQYENIVVTSVVSYMYSTKYCTSLIEDENASNTKHLQCDALSVSHGIIKLAT